MSGCVSVCVELWTFHCAVAGDALKELSVEQLRQLEGMERANVEARLAVLRDVQKLLDGAVLKLNQYSAVMATIRLKVELEYIVNACLTPSTLD